MSPLTLDIILLLVAVAFAAGFVDAIAGGGGLLTVPALLFAGLPPAEALATNKLQSTFGVAASSYAYWRSGHVALRDLVPAVTAGAIGAGLGSLAVSHIDPSWLKAVMPAVLLLVAAYFALTPRLSDDKRRRRLSAAGFAILAAMPIGFYDGILGPGTGSLFLLAFVTLAGQGVLQATGSTKVLNFTSNIAALTVFLFAGKVLFMVGLPMAVGQVLGSRLGAATAMKHGARVIKPLVVTVSSVIAVRLLLTSGNPLRDWLVSLF